MSIFLTILSYIGIIFLVLVIFNILIIVHELGHFLAALWRGLVVEKFAIWFGKPLWKKTINGVEYRLGTIPAGGYVALPQLAPMEALEGESNLSREEMPEASPLDKIIVAFAGPLFSFGLALAFACIVWVAGRPVAEINATTDVGYVMQQVPAGKDVIAPTAEKPIPLMDNPVYQEGLRTGDKVVEVDGLPVNKRVGMGDSIMWRFIRAESDKVPVTVLRDGELMTLQISPIEQNKKFYQRAALRMSPIPTPVPPVVGAFYPDSPADKAGLEEGDLITAINGEPVQYRDQVIEYVWNHPDEAAEYTVQRRILGEDGQQLFVTAQVDGKTQKIYPTIEFVVPMTPEKPVEYVNEFPPPMLGIAFTAKPEMRLIYPDPFDQVGESVMAVVNTIDAVISPSSVNVSHLSGPVGIMNLYARMLADDPWFAGWRMVLWLSVVINVNLALVNLLPLPVLDGGHITFAIIEWIRRKPVNVRVLEALNGATALLLIGFMIYVTIFDAQDAFGTGGDKPTIRFGGEAPASQSANP